MNGHSVFQRKFIYKTRQSKKLWLENYISKSIQRMIKKKKKDSAADVACGPQFENPELDQKS